MASAGVQFGISGGQIKKISPNCLCRVVVIVCERDAVTFHRRALWFSEKE